uniref:oxaloacetate tautomerase n=3 Tax=Trichobilharzia regenti TaxID=157069 RepID=A0AA85J7F0_TRIRE|nr:unnamed protein product [Trichobilharzia regenti]
MSTSLKSICRKIVAVGRNYADHAKELGNKVGDSPVIFMKPSSCIIEEGESIKMPNGTTEIHHEVELGFVIGKRLTSVKPNEVSSSSVMGYVVALDLTDRFLLNDLKSKQLPWTLAKCFDTACPVGPILPMTSLPINILKSRQEFHTVNNEIWLKVNHSERQRSKLNKMVWTPADLISIISQRISLEYGDLVLTGTPAGVGPLKTGDEVEIGLDNLCSVKFKVQ